MLDIKQKYHIKGKAGKQTDKLAHVSTAAVILMALYLLILRYIQIYHKKQKKKMLITLAVFTCSIEIQNRISLLRF